MSVAATTFAIFVTNKPHSGIPAAAAMSTARRHLALLMHGEEERFGRSLRIHRPAAHQQCDGRAEGQVSDHILSEVETQQSAQIARIRLPRARHQASNDT